MEIKKQFILKIDAIIDLIYVFEVKCGCGGGNYRTKQSIGYTLVRAAWPSGDKLSYMDD